MKKFILLLAVSSFLIFTNCKDKTQSKANALNTTVEYTNPIIPGDFADPSVIRVGDIYYAIGTSSEWAPHFPVFTSKDLVNWTQTTYAFEKTPEWTSSSFWAPELFYHNNTFFLYYVARRRSDGVSYIGVATTKNIEKGFKDHGILIEYGTEAIDPFVIDDNGKLIISWKAYGLDERPIELIAAELSDDGLKLVGEPYSLLKDDNLRGIEGQYMIKKDDYYYLFYSEGACCGSKCDYDVRVARSKILKGPYEKYNKNPILTANETWKCPGHGTMVETPNGKWIYMYHAYSQKSDVYTGRQGLIDEIVWDKNSGWPIPKNENAPSNSNHLNTSIQKIKTDFKDDFKSNKLSKSWQWDFRNSKPEISIKNNLLSLAGITNEKNKAGTALTIRPFYGNYSIETSIANTNKSLKGLTIYGDVNQCIGIGVENNNIQVWQIKNNEKKILSTVPIENYKNIQLKISVKNNNQYSFYWKNTKDWNSLKIEDHAFINGDFLPQWDRSPRPGLIQYGDKDNPAMFSYFKIEYTP